LFHLHTKYPLRILTVCHLLRSLSIYTFSELLQPGIAHPPPGSTPCIGSFCAGAGRCSPPALLTLVPLAPVLADARPSALLALAPFALVLADARPPALLAFVPSALVRADARSPPALLAFSPSALVWADARPPALLAFAPFALVRADARPRELLAFAPFALVRADAPPPALLAFAPFALVRADTVRLLLRGPPPPRGPLRAPASCLYRSQLALQAQRVLTRARRSSCSMCICALLLTSGAHQLLTV
jgi:hypothetical protein